MAQIMCTMSPMLFLSYLEFLVHLNQSGLLMSISLPDSVRSMYLSVLLHEYLYTTVSIVLMFLKISMVICYFNPHLSM